MMSSKILQKRPLVQKSKLVQENCENRYHVIKMFSPFGKICCEEFMWHTRGPKSGEPRGFAFIEFSKREEAEKAKELMNGKLALGRPLVVRFVDENIASKEIPQQSGRPSHPTISCMSSCIMNKSSKIAAIQNKLKSMEQEEWSKHKSGPRKNPRLTNSVSSCTQ
ncbi:uncharacterized protein LOC131064805 isoform X2 [Cryptomeria japonica]|uniref:uncharacterized protein LOC131064805 isoform X2 n=1 Tax=Cryptomeria japonica TaxID=3369 RepID=UPI0027DA448D|nr:uncharacterized protein LOC131064805 isoform X2 [Cryptomeria japonica]